MERKICLLLTLGLFLIANLGFCAEEATSKTSATTPKASAGKLISGFEENVPSWEIPDWCFEKKEYVAESIAISNKYAKEGKSSLEIMVNFPGVTADFPKGRWTAVYVEIQQFFDWTPYKTLSADIYLPKGALFGLEARLILTVDTVSQKWTWTEMARSIKLIPGEWTTVSANLAPGSTDWRKTQVTDAFRADVGKLGIRIESNMRPTPYSGPIYIDNVRLE